MALLVDVKAVLLQALTSGEGYGLELIKRVEDRTEGAVNLLQGRVYPALRELEDCGLVESFLGEPIPERGGRPRRFYRITAEGMKVAEKQRQTANQIFSPVWGTS